MFPRTRRLGGVAATAVTAASLLIILDYLYGTAAVQRRAHLAPPEWLSELLFEIRRISINEEFADDVCDVGMGVTRLTIRAGARGESRCT